MRGDQDSVTCDCNLLPLRIVNNGHAIQANADLGSLCADMPGADGCFRYPGSRDSNRLKLEVGNFLNSVRSA